MKGSKLTIVRKGLVLIALPALSQLVLLAFLFELQHDGVEAERMSQHSRVVLSTSEDVFRQLAHAQSDVRGYVVTSNSVFDKSAEGPLRDALVSLDKLHTLVADNPPQQRLVERIAAATADYEAWAVNVRDLVREGKHDEAVARIRDLSGKTRLDRVEQQLESFRSEEERLDGVRRQRVEHTRLLQRIVLIGATAGTLGIAIAMVVLFSRGVSRRLAVLTENARRLVGGEKLANPVSGDDEIANLDRVLHDSAVKLSTAAEAERRYKEEVEGRARELARVNQDLLQKTQENEMFVYSVSHDLRSPLVNLQGFGKELAGSCRELQGVLNGAELPAGLRERLMSIVERDMPDSLRFIQSAVTRSANIIDAMLRLSRAGRLEYRQQAVPIREVVQRVLDSVAGTITERHATLLVGELPDAWGDPTALEQVFANLIVNALNYLDPGRDGRIEVGALPSQEDGSHTRITYYVKDNGLGIPAAYLHKMFVAFQRLHGDIAKGEGIGLALVRRIVQRHGGKIWVESEENVGSTFFVSLPANGAVGSQEAQTLV